MKGLRRRLIDKALRSKEKGGFNGKESDVKDKEGFNRKDSDVKGRRRGLIERTVM